MCVWGGRGECVGGVLHNVCVCVCVCVVSWYSCVVCAIKVWMYAILRSTIAHPGISILTFRSQ